MCAGSGGIRANETLQNSAIQCHSYAKNIELAPETDVMGCAQTQYF